MALNVNALVNTSAWPLTPWEAVGSVRKKEEAPVTGTGNSSESDSLKEIKRDERSPQFVQSERKSSEDKVHDPKIWLKLLDTY